jgi:hypothetical protein
MKSVVLVALASCSSTSIPAAPATPAAPTAPAPLLGKPLAGPFATLDAYCKTRPEDSCSVRDPIPDVEHHFGGSEISDASVLYVGAEPGDTVFGCALAFRAPAGWFVTPPSTDACRNPSYIDLLDVRVSRDEAVVTFELDVNWHTKSSAFDKEGDDSASYTITTFCSADALRCVPPFTSKCEPRAPASDCGDTGYEATWTIAGSTLKLSSSSKHPAVPNGTHRLF